MTASQNTDFSRKLAYLQAILGSMPQGISVFDENLRLRVWNQGLLDVLDLPAEAVYEGVHFADLIRIPASRGMGTRTEVRCPDPACNPYLAFAMMLGAGLDGIKNDLPVPDAVNADIFEMTAAEKKEAGIASLPANLYEAVQELKASPIALEALGPHILEKYIEGKEQEWDSFRIAITDWEHKTYLSRY